MPIKPGFGAMVTVLLIEQSKGMQPLQENSFKLGSFYGSLAMHVQSFIADNRTGLRAHCRAENVRTARRLN